MPYIPHTSDEIQSMLASIGIARMEDLFADIPDSMRPRSFDVPAGLGEMEVCSRLERVAAKNNINLVSFLGAGFYDHFIPAAVDALMSRGEFVTAYTPYQPEASQGTLQAIFEYQTAVTRLFDMDCANASVYDGGSALFEACMMAVRATKRSRIVVDEAVSPIYRTMLQTYTSNLHLDLVTVPQKRGLTDFEALKAAVNGDCAAVVTQNPNFFGALADYSSIFEHAHSVGALGIIAVYPIMQSVLKTPGEMHADIAVADGQALGLPLSFGGPYLGILTCTKKMVRQMPGRIVGRTHDVDGRTGYVLTLQAREQHIRRDKATSNICSNQSLCALRSLVYLCLMGTEGLIRTAENAMSNAHYAAERLSALPGVRLLNEQPFANEFALELPMSAYALVDSLSAKGYVPGFPLERYYPGMDNVLLVACTEKHSKEQIGVLAEMVGGAL